MSLRARDAGVRLRPHFKTHQSARVGEWFRDAGVRAITVSSTAMAEYFAAHGWRDILMASPLNVREAAALDRLAARIDLHVTVDSVPAAERLAVERLRPLSVWVEIDTGDHRTGLDPSEDSTIERIVRTVLDSEHLAWGGLIAHDGQTYTAGSVAAIRETCVRTVSRLGELAAWLEERTGVRPALSIGDTPTAKLVDDLSGVDEIRPGNFVFGDLTQLRIGSFREDEIAVALASPVVSKSASRREIVLLGGAVRLSKEWIAGEDGQPIYGRLARLREAGWGEIVGGSFVSRLSQELSVVQASAELFSSIDIGDLLAVIPVHSCLTVDAMKGLTTLDGERIECFRGET